MPVYEYKGINEKGKNVKGVKEADNKRALKSLLRKEGIFPTDIYEEKVGKATKTKVSGDGKAQGDGDSWLNKEFDFAKYFQRVTLQEIALFTRQLSTLLAAGIPLVESLTALVDQTDNEKFKRILSQLKDRVNEGSSFADALREHDSLFSDLYINMVRAGETAGNLEVVLIKLADFTENQMKLRGKIQGALVYPAVMSGIGVIVVIILMTFVVPKITKLFEDINATLPIYTRILIGISHAFQSYWMFILPFIGLVIYFLRRYLKSEKGIEQFDQVVLRVPIVGRLTRMIATSRFAGTMSTLLSSGVPMLSAMGIVQTIVGNRVIARVIEDAKNNVREGESLAIPLRRSGEFDPIVGHMISVGERSGHLEEMLQHVSDAYENQVDDRINALTSLLEPLILVVMAVVVGFIIISIMMPILQINNAIR
ncbi:MAG: type II secretion system protein GspF [Deltaproteobacteria bacterium]|nr:type II secretion system protein GspF [Deltaproteobacteria bacterium]|tara:strand:- start:2142 stop:3416 length:1275 start_codon:yes stop_codon:yes gene_type:complete